MGKSREVITKHYTFSNDERESLNKVEIGLVSFEQAVMGMQLNKNMLLQNAYRRCGLEDTPKEGYSRSISYNLATGNITVTLTPKDEVEPKAR